jgi:hypothetical protein
LDEVMRIKSLKLMVGLPIIISSFSSNKNGTTIFLSILPKLLKTFV